MAREWETPPVERFDPRVDWYRIHSRRSDAVEERRFRPEKLTEQNLRSGDTRRFLLDQGFGDLDEVFTVKNSYEGLVD
jgi:hypothetical protein